MTRLVRSDDTALSVSSMMASSVIGIGFDAPCQRIAAQGPEAYLLVHDFFSRLEAHAVVVDHDDVAVTIDAGPFLGKVQRDDVDVFPFDVLPDIFFRPVGNGKYAHTFPLVNMRVVQFPHFRTLVLRIPSLGFVAEGEDAFLGAGLFFVAPAAAKSCREAVLVEGLL